MTRLALPLLCAALLPGADLREVRTVYVLKMSKGMDQYLANRLTNDHVFQVVTDPKLADAVLTDRIGDSFQARLEELFPDPQPPLTAATANKDAADKGKDKEKDSKDKDSNPGGLLSEPMNKLSSPASSFGAATGTVFLVDAKSRQVVWSVYDLPKDSTSRQLDRTASDIVNRIKRDLKKKSQ